MIIIIKQTQNAHTMNLPIYDLIRFLSYEMNIMSQIGFRYNFPIWKMKFRVIRKFLSNLKIEHF